MTETVEQGAGEAQAAAATKNKTQITTVTMDDGRVVDFPGKRRMSKTSKIENDTVVIQMDFVNGETRSYRIVPELLLKFAAHGAEQKLGDEIAGVEDVEDAIEAIDELRIRLERGEWNVARQKSAGNSIAGASILVRALVELTGKPVDTIRESLASRTQEEKIALRRNSQLRPIIERLEAEKNARKAKKTGMDSEALLENILSGTTPADPSAVVGAQAEAAAA